MGPKTVQWFYIPVLGRWILLAVRVDRDNYLCRIWWKMGDEPTVLKWGHFKKDFKKPSKTLHSDGSRVIWYGYIGGPKLGWQDKNWSTNEAFLNLLRTGARQGSVLTPAEALALRKVHKSFGRKPNKYFARGC